MKAFEIELPEHVLRFSIPEEITREWPIKHTRWFEPQSPSFERAGFYVVFEALHDVNGPFWLGAYGSLKIHVMVQRRKHEIAGDITTVDGLELYVPVLRMTSAGPQEQWTFSQASLNGLAALRGKYNTFGNTGGHREHTEIFSLPLDAEMFLDIGFRVVDWGAGRRRERKWRPKAEAVREAIKATIVLEPKSAR
jgi:hypothetical protein